MTNSEHKGRSSTLSVLWVFAILNIVFRDIHEFTTATTINEILSGRLNGNVITEEVLFYGAFAVELLLLGFLLSALLPPRHARTANLILAPLALLGGFLVPPGDLDDYFFATVVSLTYIAIFVLAWTWRPQAGLHNARGANHAT